MKIAVLVYGQYREFEIAVQSWKFLNLPFEFDIYFSTWNTSNSIQTDGTFSEIESVTEERILKNIKCLKGCKIVPDLIEPSAIIASEKIMHKIIHHIKSCINMMLESKECYDNVILLRPDLWIDEKIDVKGILSTTCPDNIVHTYGELTENENNEKVLMDNMFICNMETIIKFLNLPIIKNGDIHRVFGKLFFDNGLQANVFPHPYEILITRINCRELNEVTQKGVSEKYYEWLVRHNRRWRLGE